MFSLVKGMYLFIYIYFIHVYVIVNLRFTHIKQARFRGTNNHGEKSRSRL